MGAINKSTNKYEYPAIAEKTNKYSCPDCKKDVILRKGEIRIHHFAHYKSDTPCRYYDHPGESQIHKDAKMALKAILEGGKDIEILRNCNVCHINPIISIHKYTGYTVKIEHYFTFNDSKKFADVACLEGDSIKYVFEICYKHRTLENDRPEPWFEFNAEKLLYDINKEESSENLIKIYCMRNHKCSTCIIKEKVRQRIIEEQYKQRIKEEQERQRIREVFEKERIKKELEKQRIKEEEEKKRREFFEMKQCIGAEIKKRIWGEHKRCSKCKSYERCVKCVDKLNQKYNIELNEALEAKKQTITKDF